MSLVTAARTAVGGATRSRSRRRQVLPLLALLCDVLVISLVGILAAVLREQIRIYGEGADVLGRLTLPAPLILLAWLLSIYLVGGYTHNIYGAGADEYKRVVNATLIVAGIVGMTCYLTSFELSRGFFLFSIIMGIPGVALGRFFLRKGVQRAHRRGHLRQRVLIAGSRSHIDEIAAVLRRETWLGYDIVGALTPASDGSATTASGIPVLGNADDAAAIVDATDVDIIFFAGGAHKSASALRETVWDLEQRTVQVVVAPSVTEVSSERIAVRPVGGLPLMHIDPPRITSRSQGGKRLFDLLASSVLLVLLSPLFLVTAIYIKAHDRGPVIFRQQRVGRNGRIFVCLKFRSMVLDAEEQLPSLREELRYDEGLFKLPHDPRVTRPGRWLRRYSIDELPQLVNVLRGEMSLVGPRPPLPDEVAGYHEHVYRRLRVHPGMTGLWQVSGRSDLSWSEAVRLDLFYVDNWSMVQDLSILYKTIGAVLRSRGAY